MKRKIPPLVIYTEEREREFICGLHIFKVVRTIIFSTYKLCFKLSKLKPPKW